MSGNILFSASCFSGLYYICIPNSKHQRLSWSNFCMDLANDKSSWTFCVADTTDLSLSAFEILGHMLKNGKHSWRKTKLNFTETLAKVDTVYARWDISSVKTSFRTDIESVLPFLTSDFPQLRLHGLWTIACDTRQNNSTFIRIDRLHLSLGQLCPVIQLNEGRMQSVN